jgi:plasmid stabilization system protein ParE
VAQRVELHAAARNEVAEAFDWYQRRSVQAADSFVRELTRGLGLIAESPELWPTYELDSRRYILRRYPYSLVYRAGADSIVVVAVAHHSRQPGYWQGR